MKKLLIILLFLFSITSAVECFNGDRYVEIPKQVLPEIGYKEYSITHSSYDCKWAYRRYKQLNIQVEQPKNQIQQVTESKKTELPKIPLFVIIGFILFCIWLIIKICKTDDECPVIQKPVNVYRKTEKRPEETESFYERLGQVPVQPTKSWTDLSNEYSENLRKIEQERERNGFYKTEKPKPLNLPINNSQSQYKFKSEYDFLLHRQEWLDCREHVFAEKGRHCCYCYKTNGLQVHHKFYLAYPNGKKVKPWEYPMDAFKVLCYDCHVKEHQTHKIKFYRISYKSNPKAFKCS